MNKNPNCDGGHCVSALGEVRVYPLGGGANLILCRVCWEHENRYRFIRSVAANDLDSWPQVNWDKSKVYGADE